MDMQTVCGNVGAYSRQEIAIYRDELISLGKPEIAQEWFTRETRRADYQEAIMGKTDAEITAITEQFQKRAIAEAPWLTVWGNNSTGQESGILARHATEAAARIDARLWNEDNDNTACSAWTRRVEE